MQTRILVRRLHGTRRRVCARQSSVVCFVIVTVIVLPTATHGGGRRGSYHPGRGGRPRLLTRRRPRRLPSLGRRSELDRRHPHRFTRRTPLVYAEAGDGGNERGERHHVANPYEPTIHV